MQEKINSRIQALADWDEIDSFEANVRQLDQWTDEVSQAVQSRSDGLARQLITEKTGLALANLRPAEEAVVRALSAFTAIRKRQRKSLEYTFRSLRNNGLLGAAEAAVNKAAPTKGFQELTDADLAILSFEQIILDHPEDFSERAQAHARRRLGIDPPGLTLPAPTDTESQSRNPAWSRDELILALHLYLNHRSAPPGKSSAEVVGLSAFLNRLGEALGLDDHTTYRNANGVYMKMMNFRRFDTEYTKDGRVGLTRGNKDEEVVWKQFAHDLPSLSRIVAAIHAAVNGEAIEHVLNGGDEPDIQEAPEGRVLTRLHRYRERSRKLVDACKRAATKRHGRLACEACGFDFSAVYGDAGNGLIDVHHTKPVHTLAEGDITRIEDLVLLCANCHRIVHSSRNWLSVAQVRALIERRRNTT